MASCWNKRGFAPCRLVTGAAPVYVPKIVMLVGKAPPAGTLRDGTWGDAALAAEIAVPVAAAAPAKVGTVAGTVLGVPEFRVGVYWLLAPSCKPAGFGKLTSAICPKIVGVPALEMPVTVPSVPILKLA